MKPTFHLLPTLFLIGCSTHQTTQTKPECIQYQQELNELKNQQRNSTMQSIASFALNGTIMTTDNDSKRNDQKIRILEMKLAECRK